MLCILYVNILGAILGIAGRLAESLLPTGTSRRWIWCAVIALSVAIPPVYQAKHAIPVASSRLAAPVVGGAGVHHPGAAASALSVPSWWSSESVLSRAVGRAWLVASMLLLLIGLSEAWRISRRLRATSGTGAAHTMMIDGVEVFVSDALGPATVGVRRPRVIVPRWILGLPPVERSFIVRHEEEHRRANDPRLLWVSSLTLVLLPWNIPLWWQLRRLGLAVETDCDHRVVSALGNAHRYGELLLKVASAAKQGPRLQPGFADGRGALEQRLVTLVAPSSTRGMRRVLSLAAVAGLLYLAFTVPHPVPAKATSTTVTSSSLATGGR